MLRHIKGMFNAPRPAAPVSRQRPKFFFTETPDVLYAIGDIHGCIDQFLRLQDLIAEDARNEPGEKVLVTLGDYIDRGPDSAGVVERLLEPAPRDLRCFHLAGNHEAVMLDFLRNPGKDHDWLRFGGIQSLSSYGMTEVPEDPRDMEVALRTYIPHRHIAFLTGLPSLISFPEICFVHAGIDGRVPLREQRDEVLLWKRPGPEAAEYPFVLVHGHTPADKVEITTSRINVDTGAYATGTLSAVKIRKNGEVFVVSCNR